VSADGRTAVSGAVDKTVRVWDLAAGRCSAVLEGHTGGVHSVAVSTDGRTAVSGAWDNTVRVWDLAAGRCTATHAKDSEEVRRAWATVVCGRTVVATVETHGLMIRDTIGGATLAHFPGTFTTAGCSADGRHVVAGDGRGGIYLLRLHTRRQ
jgi:WD40 repeat protein